MQKGEGQGPPGTTFNSMTHLTQQPLSASEQSSENFASASASSWIVFFWQTGLTQTDLGTVPPTARRSDNAGHLDLVARRYYKLPRHKTRLVLHQL